MLAGQQEAMGFMTLASKLLGLSGVDLAAVALSAANQVLHCSCAITNNRSHFLNPFGFNSVEWPNRLQLLPLLVVAVIHVIHIVQRCGH